MESLTAYLRRTDLIKRIVDVTKTKYNEGHMR